MSDPTRDSEDKQPNPGDTAGQGEPSPPAAEPPREEPEATETPAGAQTGQDNENARPAAPSRRGGSLLAVFLAFLALIVSLAVAGAGYYFWNTLEARFAAQEEGLATVTEALATFDDHPALQELRREMNVQTRDLNEANTELARRIDALQSSVEAVHELTTRGQHDWITAEVQYLILIANHRLHLMRDFDGAIAALEAADQRLHELADITLLPVREILADEIQSLKDFQRPDTVGIALRLDRMISGLKPLPLAMPEEGEPAASSDMTGTADTEGGLQGFFHTIWSELNQQITIRRHDGPVRTLPDAEMELHLHQMLRLRLEASRVAVLRQDDAEYHRQLEAAKAFVAEFYSGPRAEELSAELAGLDTVNLRPELPEITAAYSKLREIESRPATPATTSDAETNG